MYGLQVTRSVVILPIIKGDDQYPQYDELDKSSKLYDRNKAMTMVLGCLESGIKEMPVLPLTVDPNRILDDFEYEISEQYLRMRISVEPSKENRSFGAIWDMVSSFLPGGNWKQSANPVEEKYHHSSMRFQCRNATKKKPNW